MHMSKSKVRRGLGPTYGKTAGQLTTGRLPHLPIQSPTVSRPIRTSKFVLELAERIRVFNTLAGTSMMLKFFLNHLVFLRVKAIGPRNRLVLVQPWEVNPRRMV